MDWFVTASPLLAAVIGNYLLFITLDAHAKSASEGRSFRPAGLPSTSGLALMILLIAIDMPVVLSFLMYVEYEQVDLLLAVMAIGGAVVVGQCAFWGILWMLSRTHLKQRELGR